MIYYFSGLCRLTVAILFHMVLAGVTHAAAFHCDWAGRAEKQWGWGEEDWSSQGTGNKEKHILQKA